MKRVKIRSPLSNGLTDDWCLFIETEAPTLNPNTQPEYLVGVFLRLSSHIHGIETVKPPGHKPGESKILHAAAQHFETRYMQTNIVQSLKQELFLNMYIVFYKALYRNYYTTLINPRTSTPKTLNPNP